ncbi:MAG: hypothetical protein PQJ48_11945 [Sphaerochaetaceae bacterium]|nr:hypothetical protein [Sphaerochaetaceae bacterium]
MVRITKRCFISLLFVSFLLFLSNCDFSINKAPILKWRDERINVHTVKSKPNDIETDESNFIVHLWLSSNIPDSGEEFIVSVIPTEYSAQNDSGQVYLWYHSGPAYFPISSNILKGG